MNCWTGIGRIGQDIDSRYTTGAEPKAVARFSIAVNRNKEETDWLNCVAFGRTAENISKYFSKGSQIGITGRIQTGSYKKDVNGQTITIYTTDIIVDRFDFVGKKEDNEQPRGFTTMAEDIPF